ncbi:MAG TPA: histidinol dehydrogenase [Tepidisphaeraceae bacterium]|nr:histidinol dehydrogenase [Tepidisphaeraceae bacterium]
MIPILRLDDETDRQRAESLLDKLRLDPRRLVLETAKDDESVRQILADVARRGDGAIVDSARRFDDPDFTREQIRVTLDEMRDAAAGVSSEQMKSVRRSISQVRRYQSKVMPREQPHFEREGVQLGMRFIPLDSAGLYFPGGKASYPSTLIMLAVPAQVAGVKEIVVCSPASRFGRSDLVLATCLELGLTHVYRAGGAAAIAAMAFGTAIIPAVDKIVGPGNRYVQLAKRALSGAVGIDGFLGPSEIVVIADESGDPRCIAADLLAQAEHDPGSCFLITPSRALATQVVNEIEEQKKSLTRNAAIDRALDSDSAILISPSMESAIDWANRFAAEHVNIQTKNDEAVLAKLRHAGAVFLGRNSPVAAGDYVAGPSHCLPTNTTARFTSGISVYEFLRRSSVERYTAQGIAADGPAIIALAEAEGLDAHAASVRVRTESR